LPAGLRRLVLDPAAPLGLTFTNAVDLVYDF
jgi:hypothetical protein